MSALTIDPSTKLGYNFDKETFSKWCALIARIIGFAKSTPKGLGAISPQIEIIDLLNNLSNIATLNDIAMAAVMGVVMIDSIGQGMDTLDLVEAEFDINNFFATLEYVNDPINAAEFPDKTTITDENGIMNTNALCLIWKNLLSRHAEMIDFAYSDCINGIAVLCGVQYIHTMNGELPDHLGPTDLAKYVQDNKLQKPFIRVDYDSMDTVNIDSFVAKFLCS